MTPLLENPNGMVGIASVFQKPGPINRGQYYSLHNPQGAGTHLQNLEQTQTPWGSVDGFLHPVGHSLLEGVNVRESQLGGRYLISVPEACPHR